MEEICIIMGRYAFVTVITLVQKFTIVAKLWGFFLIYCTTVNLDIQFLTKGIHLLSTLIFKDDSLKMFKMTMGCKPFIELLSA